MIEDVKLSLRISTDDFDTEIQDLIEAAKIDLNISGVNKTEESDYLTKRAIIIYCKAHFGYDNPDAERFEESYVMLKQLLALSSDYEEVVVDET